jgi:hypothetical protein
VLEAADRSMRRNGVPQPVAVATVPVSDVENGSFEAA